MIMMIAILGMMMMMMTKRSVNRGNEGGLPHLIISFAGKETVSLFRYLQRTKILHAALPLLKMFLTVIVIMIITKRNDNNKKNDDSNLFIHHIQSQLRRRADSFHAVTQFKKEKKKLMQDARANKQPHSYACS